MTTIWTKWEPIESDAPWFDEHGEAHYAWPWAADLDSTIGVDLTAKLHAAETPTLSLTRLTRLKASDETADADASHLIVGAEIVDVVALVRLAGLAAERVYRLYVKFGDLGDERFVTVGIVVEA